MSKNRTAITFLTVPAMLFFVMQASSVGMLLLRWGDAPVSPRLGFGAFAVGSAAFLCSAPALAVLSRSDIRGLPRYMLMAVHILWLVIGGVILFAGLLLKVILPLFQRWVAQVYVAAFLFWSFDLTHVIVPAAPVNP